MCQFYTPAARIGGRKSALFLLFALTAALMWSAFDMSSQVLADEAGAAAPAAEGAAAPAGAGVAPAAPVSRNFLSYIASALGWFWGPAFLLLSFILVALITLVPDIVLYLPRVFGYKG